MKNERLKRTVWIAAAVICSAVIMAAGMILPAYSSDAIDPKIDTLPLYGIQTVCDHGNRVYAKQGNWSMVVLAVVKGCGDETPSTPTLP